jgi:hypothetical protein
MPVRDRVEGSIRPVDMRSLGFDRDYLDNNAVESTRSVNSTVTGLILVAPSKPELPMCLPQHLDRSPDPLSTPVRPQQCSDDAGHTKCDDRSVGDVYLRVGAELGGR